VYIRVADIRRSVSLFTLLSTLPPLVFHYICAFFPGFSVCCDSPHPKCVCTFPRQTRWFPSRAAGVRVKGICLLWKYSLTEDACRAPGRL